MPSYDVGGLIDELKCEVEGRAPGDVLAADHLGVGFVNVDGPGHEGDGETPDAPRLVAGSARAHEIVLEKSYEDLTRGVDHAGVVAGRVRLLFLGKRFPVELALLAMGQGVIEPGADDGGRFLDHDTPIIGGCMAHAARQACRNNARSRRSFGD